MRHAIPLDALGPAVEPIATAVEACVHCGCCLPTCPTYVTLGEEMDSPRGRILLMKQVLEGELEREEAMPFIDNCLGCQSCVTAREYPLLFTGEPEAERARALADRALDVSAFLAA